MFLILPFFSLNIAPSASKDMNSYHPQGLQTKYNTATRKTIVKEFVTNTKGATISVKRAEHATGQRVFSL